jgi:hypothetical protein
MELIRIEFSGRASINYYNLFRSELDLSQSSQTNYEAIHNFVSQMRSTNSPYHINLILSNVELLFRRFSYSNYNKFVSARENKLLNTKGNQSHTRTASLNVSHSRNSTGNTSTTNSTNTGFNNYLYFNYSDFIRVLLPSTNNTQNIV